MSATNLLEVGLLNLLMLNTNLANIGDATGLRGSSTAGVFYISIHTGDPGETGSQTSSEAAYTSYARVSVARDVAKWVVVTGVDSISVADNLNLITFPTATGGSETETHAGVGSASSGAGNLFIYGILTSNLPVSSGVIPEFAIGALDITLI